MSAAEHLSVQEGNLFSVKNTCKELNTIYRERIEQNCITLRGFLATVLNYRSLFIIDFCFVTI
jgi:hypothetical protein